MIPGQHRGRLPRLCSPVCNFMSHEKCLKQVKTPCSSVAPSLVRVRVKCGWGEGAGRLCGRQSWGWYSGLRSDGMGRGPCLGLGWERPLCCSESGLRTAPLLSPSPSQPGLLPTAPHPSLHFPQNRPSCLWVGPPPVSFGLPQMYHRRTDLGKWSVPGLPGQRSWVGKDQQGCPPAEGGSLCDHCGGFRTALALHRVGQPPENLSNAV